MGLEVRLVFSGKEKNEASNHCSRDYWRNGILKKGYFFSKQPEMFIVIKKNGQTQGTLGIDFKYSLNKKLSLEEISDLNINQLPAVELMRFSASCEKRWLFILARFLIEEVREILEKKNLLSAPIVMGTHWNIIRLFEKVSVEGLFRELPEKIKKEKLPPESRCFVENRKTGIFKIENSVLERYVLSFRNGLGMIP